MFFTPIRDRLIPASNEQAPIVVLSNLTRMECRVHPRRSGNDELLARFDDFFASSDLDWVLMNRLIFDLATELRAFQNLRTPDALHLAAAIQHGCTEFWTNDLRLKSAAANRIQIINPLASAKE